MECRTHCVYRTLVSCWQERSHPREPFIGAPVSAAERSNRSAARRPNVPSSCLLELLHCVRHGSETVYTAKPAFDAFAAKTIPYRGARFHCLEPNALSRDLCRHRGKRMSAL